MLSSVVILSGVPVALKYIKFDVPVNKDMLLLWSNVTNESVDVVYTNLPVLPTDSKAYAAFKVIH